jgi:hypothetical protein
MTDYYVDAVDGNDANAGTSEGSGNAWKTLGKAESTIVAGDKVWVKGNASYTETLTLSVTFGTSGGTCPYEGYTTTPGDGGMFTIDATGLSNGVTDGFSTRNFRTFINMRVTGATTIGVNLATGDFALFINCEFDNNGTIGIDLDNNSNCIQCKARDNGGAGFQGDFNNVYYKCESTGNGGSGFSGQAFWIGCLAWGNDATSVPIVASSSGGTNLMVGCTVAHDDTSQACFTYFQSYSHLIWDTIFYQGSYGIDPGSGTHLGVNFTDHCLFYGQSSGDIEGTDLVNGPNNISGEDPLFTDAASGDFGIDDASPAVDAGADPGLRPV